MVACEVEAVAYITSGRDDATSHCVTFGAAHINLETVGAGYIEESSSVKGTFYYTAKPFTVHLGCPAVENEGANGTRKSPTGEDKMTSGVYASGNFVLETTISVGTVAEPKSIIMERKKTAPFYFIAVETPREVSRPRNQMHVKNPFTFHPTSSFLSPTGVGGLSPLY